MRKPPVPGSAATRPWGSMAREWHRLRFRTPTMRRSGRTFEDFLLGTTKDTKYTDGRRFGMTPGARGVPEQGSLCKSLIFGVFGGLRGLTCRFWGEASADRIIGASMYASQIVVCAGPIPGVCSNHENHHCYL